MNSTTQVLSTAQELPDLPPPADLRAFPALRRSFRRGDRAQALGEAGRRGDAELERERLDGETKTDALGPLEAATKTFRYLRARAYQRSAGDARRSKAQSVDAYQRAASVGLQLDLQEELRRLDARARWYDGRASAQPVRFDSIRACGSRLLSVSCVAKFEGHRVCGESLCAPLACRCGIVRRCDACVEFRAAQRQKKLAAARVEAIRSGHREGLFFPRRVGGAFSEKMLTLTVPHFDLEETAGELRAACVGFGLETTVHARLAALRLAWPRFVQKLRRAVKRRKGAPAIDAKRMHYYRLLEWTRGHDGKGHPHFHVYLFAPWLDVRALRGMWARSLEAVGLSLPTSCKKCDAGEECFFSRGEPHVNVRLDSLDGFNWATLNELIKTGKRRAIEERLGKLTGGDRAIKYAGWVVGDAFGAAARDADLDVQRDLYCALEGRRLAQGSRGFLLPPRRPLCSCCGQSVFAAAVVDQCAAPEESPPALARVRFAWEERGPP